MYKSFWYYGKSSKYTILAFKTKFQGKPFSSFKVKISNINYSCYKTDNFFKVIFRPDKCSLAKEFEWLCLKKLMLRNVLMSLHSSWGDSLKQETSNRSHIHFFFFILYLRYLSANNCEHQLWVAWQKPSKVTVTQGICQLRRWEERLMLLCHVRISEWIHTL